MSVSRLYFNIDPFIIKTSLENIRKFRLQLYTLLDTIVILVYNASLMINRRLKERAEESSFESCTDVLLVLVPRWNETLDAELIVQKPNLQSKGLDVQHVEKIIIQRNCKNISFRICMDFLSISRTQQRQLILETFASKSCIYFISERLLLISS